MTSWNWLARRALIALSASLAFGLGGSAALAQVFYIVPQSGNNYYGANDVLVPIGGVNPGYYQGGGAGLGRATGGFYGAYNTQAVANPGTYSTSGVAFNAYGVPLNPGVPAYGALGYGGSPYGGVSYYGYTPYYPRPGYTPPYVATVPQAQQVPPAQIIQVRPRPKTVTRAQGAPAARSQAPARPAAAAPSQAPARASAPAAPNRVVTPPAPPAQSLPGLSGPRIIQPRANQSAGNAASPSRANEPAQRKTAPRTP